MDTDRIQEIRDSKERARLRNFENFQATGDQKYYTKYHAYEELVDICDLALSKNNYRQEAGSIKADYIMLATKASRLVHMAWDEQEAKDLLKELIADAKTYGFDDRYV